MQSGVLWDPKSQRRHDSEKSCWQQELRRLKYIGQIGFGGSFVIRVLQLYSLVDQLPLGGWRRGFSPSSSVSSSITRLSIILCLHLSSLTLVLYFYYLLFMFMHQSSYRFIALHLLLFHTQISQSKSNLAVIFNWGSE